MQELLPLLTRDGQQVFSRAKQMSKQYNQPDIDSDVLLLALLQLSGSQTEGVLRALRIKVENLTARLLASIKLQSRQTQLYLEIGNSPDKATTDLSTESMAIFKEARAEAQENELDFIDTRLLLLGMLRCPNSKAGQFLSQYGVILERFRAQANVKETPVINLPIFKPPRLSVDRLFFGISPIFIGLFTDYKRFD